MEYTIQINGKISNRKSESDLQNVIFCVLKDAEIAYANEWLNIKKDS